MHASVSRQRRITLTLLAVISLGFGTCAAAQPPPPKQATPTVSSSTQVQRKAPPISYNSGTAPALSADPGKVTMELKPNGIRLYHLNGQGMQTLSAHVDANGKLDLRCNNQVEQALKQPSKQGDQQ